MRDVAISYGLPLYIVATLVFIVLAGVVSRQLSQPGQSALISFTQLLIVQAAGLFQFLAFSALVGHFPVELAAASVTLAFVAWLIQGLLLRLASSPLDKGDAQRIRLIVLGDQPRALIAMGVAAIVVGLAQLFLQFRAGWLFSPREMGSPAYQATMAAYTLVLPALLSLLVSIPFQVALMRSKYAPPALRNLALAACVFSLLSGGILIFGPLYFYREGFASMGVSAPANILLAYGATIACAQLLLIPYFEGFRKHSALEHELKDTRTELEKRVITILSWEPGEYRRQEADVLLNRLLKEYERLTENEPLRFFGLTLFQALLEANAADGARERRTEALKRLGFGETPIEQIKTWKGTIRALPQFHSQQFQDYFNEVEKYHAALPASHPLLLHFLRLSTVLLAYIDGNRDLKYICADLLALEGEHEKSNARPALALGTIGTTIVGVIYRLFETDVRAWLSPLARSIARLFG